MTGKPGLLSFASQVESCMKPIGKFVEVGVNVLQIFLHANIIAGKVHWYLSLFQPKFCSPKKYTGHMNALVFIKAVEGLGTI